LSKLGQKIPVTVLPRGASGPLWTGTRARIRQLQLLGES
jgi:hypothetical protein